MGFSCCFGGLSYSLHFSLLFLLHHDYSQQLDEPGALDILLTLFESSLLWIEAPL